MDHHHTHHRHAKSSSHHSHHKQSIKSESLFLIHLIGHLIATPFRFILFLFGKQQFKHVMMPIHHTIAFLTQAKFTFYMVLTLLITYIASLFFSLELLESLIAYPADPFTGRYHTLITSGFLHANLAHLLGNCIALFIFGRVVERKLGSVVTALIYTGALILSGLFSAAIHHYVLLDATGGLGASGAIMGLVATAMLLDPFYLTYHAVIPVPIMVLGWLAIYADITGILNPTATGIGHLAHIGGFLSVSLLVYLLHPGHKDSMKKGLMINIVSFILVLIIVQVFLR